MKNSKNIISKLCATLYCLCNGNWEFINHFARVKGLNPLKSKIFRVIGRRPQGRTLAPYPCASSLIINVD